MAGSFADSLHHIELNARSKTDKLHREVMTLTHTRDSLRQEADQLIRETKKMEEKNEQIEDQLRQNMKKLSVFGQSLEGLAKTKYLLENNVSQLTKSLDDEKRKTGSRKDRMDQILNHYRQKWQEAYESYESLPEALSMRQAEVHCHKAKARYLELQAKLKQKLEEKADAEKEQAMLKEERGLNSFVLDLARIKVETEKLKQQKRQLSSKLYKLKATREEKTSQTEDCEKNSDVSSKVPVARSQAIPIPKPHNALTRKSDLPATLFPGRGTALCPIRTETLNPSGLCQNDSTPTVTKANISKPPAEGFTSFSIQPAKLISSSTQQKTAELDSNLDSSLVPRLEKLLITAPTGPSAMTPPSVTSPSKTPPATLSPEEHHHILATLYKTPEFRLGHRKMFVRKDNDVISPLTDSFDIQLGLAPPETQGTVITQTEPKSPDNKTSELQDDQVETMESEVVASDTPTSEETPNIEVQTETFQDGENGEVRFFPDEPLINGERQSPEEQGTQATVYEDAIDVWPCQQNEPQHSWYSDRRNNDEPTASSPPDASAAQSAAGQEFYSPGMDWETRREGLDQAPYKSSATPPTFSFGTLQDSGGDFQFSFGVRDDISGPSTSHNNNNNADNINNSNDNSNNPFSFFGNGDSSAPANNTNNDANPFSFFGGGDQTSGFGNTDSHQTGNSFFTF